MRTRIGVLTLGILLAVPLLAVAQPRTSPATLDFTCHGYDEGATRAYNCIPPPSERHHMRTFMPAVGPPNSVDFEIADLPAVRCADDHGGLAVFS